MPLPRRSFLYLRHGETDWNIAGRNQGRTDIALNARGVEQAHAAARALAGVSISTIIASPLARCRHTAEIVAQAVRAPLMFHDDLMEASFGVEEGRIRGQGGWYKAWVAGEATPEGAESFAELKARALRGLAAAIGQPGPVLVVAHGTLWRAARAALGLPFDTPLPNAVPLSVSPEPPPSTGWLIEELSRAEL